MNFTVTRLGGTISMQVNNGPITIAPRPEYETLVLSVDGEEVDRKQIGLHDTYSIALSGGDASLVIHEFGRSKP